MTCPVCSAVIEDGTEICPECGSPINVIESEDSGHPWVLVYTTNTDIDAAMFKANLESAGIETYVMSQADSAFQFTIGELDIIKIYVHQPDVSDAMDIIRSIEENRKGEQVSDQNEAEG